jgi:hypothetical protein
LRGNLVPEEAQRSELNRIRGIGELSRFLRYLFRIDVLSKRTIHERDGSKIICHEYIMGISCASRQNNFLILICFLPF